MTNINVRIYADGLRKDLSLDDIFNDWEVCIKKITRQTISKKRVASNV